MNIGKYINHFIFIYKMSRDYFIDLPIETKFEICSYLRDIDMHGLYVYLGPEYNKFLDSKKFYMYAYIKYKDRTPFELKMYSQYLDEMQSIIGSIYQHFKSNEY